ncbi:DNA/RNA polymerase [Mycena kentingensis (nom. inval.)]|nr:DNA/RNA polymerase [Mycena kentingensis (nom. inval.)]
MLCLWDELGIPHNRAKQVHGSILTVIGFEVNTVAMTFSMTDEQWDELVAAVDDFYREPPAGGRRRTLHESQRLAGWVNWALNVHPLLHPALANIYAKTVGKTRPDACLHLNNAIADDLRCIPFRCERL